MTTQTYLITDVSGAEHAAAAVGVDVVASANGAGKRRSDLMTANDVELCEQMRVCHPDFQGPGTVLRVVLGEPGAVVRWDLEIAEPARTIIAKPQHLIAIGLGRDVTAHLTAMFEALGLHAEEPDPAQSIPARPTQTRREGPCARRFLRLLLWKRRPDG